MEGEHMSLIRVRNGQKCLKNRRLQKPVHKTFHVGPNSFFKQSKERVRCDPKRLKNHASRCVGTCFNTQQYPASKYPMISTENGFEVRRQVQIQNLRAVHKRRNDRNETAESSTVVNDQSLNEGPNCPKWYLSRFTLFLAGNEEPWVCG